MPTVLFQHAGVKKTTEMPAAAHTPSTTPRALPNAKAPTAPLPGRAATCSTKACAACDLKITSTRRGALIEVRFTVTKHRHIRDGQKIAAGVQQRHGAKAAHFKVQCGLHRELELSG
jgi:hypothetical protein